MLLLEIPPSEYPFLASILVPGSTLSGSPPARFTFSSPIWERPTHFSFSDYLTNLAPQKKYVGMCDDFPPP